MNIPKLALFIDFDHVSQQLKTIYNQSFQPQSLLDKSSQYGHVVFAQAYGDFSQEQADIRQELSSYGIRPIQTDPESQRRNLGGRSVEVLKDNKDLEILADLFELLLESPHIDALMFVLGDRQNARGLGLARHRFHKTIILSGVHGAITPQLLRFADVVDPLAPAPVVPENPEYFTKLIAIIEALESTKRYLNFKFIRDRVLAECPDWFPKSERADALLSEAIDCGLVIKRKIEDKFNPKQFFTAYSLNKNSALYHLLHPHHDPRTQEAPRSHTRGPASPNSASSNPSSSGRPSFGNLDYPTQY